MCIFSHVWPMRSITQTNYMPVKINTRSVSPRCVRLWVYWTFVGVLTTVSQNAMSINLVLLKDACIIRVMYFKRQMGGNIHLEPASDYMITGPTSCVDGDPAYALNCGKGVQWFQWFKSYTTMHPKNAAILLIVRGFIIDSWWNHVNYSPMSFRVTSLALGKTKRSPMQGVLYWGL